MAGRVSQFGLEPWKARSGSARVGQLGIEPWKTRSGAVHVSSFGVEPWISTPPTYPNFPFAIRPPSRLTWSLETASLVFTSPLKRQAQTFELPGGVWMATATWAALPPAEWRAMMVFLATCRGARNSFYVSPWHALAPQLAVAGSPLVSGNSQTGTTLATRGWSAGSPGLQPGDLISWSAPFNGSEMHIVTAGQTIGGDGTSSIAIEPPIRTSPPDGTAILYDPPQLLMRLADDRQFSFDMENTTWAPLTLSFIEAIIPSAPAANAGVPNCFSLIGFLKPLTLGANVRMGNIGAALGTGTSLGNLNVAPTCTLALGNLSYF